MARQPAKSTASDQATAAPAAKPARAPRRTRKPAVVAEPVAAPPAAPVAPPRRRPRIHLPTLESSSTNLRKVILNIGFVLAILIFIPVLASQFLRDQVLIEPISVPKAVLQRGLTPEVVASRLWDGLRDANAKARTSKATLSAIPNSQRVQFSLPDVGLSMDSIVRQTRQFFNIYQTRISGEFVCADTSCVPSEMRLRLRVLRGTSDVIDMPPIGDQNLRDYFTAAAIQVLSVLDPFVAVSAISGTEPVRATALARRLIRQHHPDAKWAYNLIGNLRSIAQDYRPALAEYRAAVALDPNFTIARANVAITLSRLGDPVAARAEYDAISKSEPNNPDVMAGYAELAAAAGKPDEAIAYLQKALTLNPSAPQYLSRMGEIEDSRGNKQAAADYYRRALVLDPAFPLALQPLFTTALLAGDTVAAEALLRDAADYEPDSAEVQGLHGAALVYLQRPEEALAAFDRALAIAPDNAEILYQSASMLQSLDRQAEAIQRLDRTIELDPYNAAPIFSRGTSLALTGNNAGARADFQRVLELDTTGTNYHDMAVNFLGILDGLDSASPEPAADTPAAPADPKLASPDGPRAGVPL
jgi:tetratricopeptide (TPR) repeat protein